MTASRKALIVFGLLIAIALGLPWDGAVREASAQISVTGADPPTGEQGSLNLSVVISGKGFKNGAKAKFYRSHITPPDTGGIDVKSTQFVSSTQLVATIDIADTAALSTFDIQVANTDGRTGKGTELFSVVEKGKNAPVYVAEFAEPRPDDPTWFPKIRGDGLGPYAALVEPGYRLHVEANQSDGRSIVFQFDDPYPLWQAPLRCKVWGRPEQYERDYPPILLSADRVVAPRLTQITTGTELTYDEALGKWVRILQSVSRSGRVTYRVLDPFAMNPGQKSYATLLLYFVVPGEAGYFYVKFNDTFMADLVGEEGGVVEVERDGDGETWYIRPISKNFPVLGEPPTLIPQYQANFRLYDTPDLKDDPGGNCNFGNFMMKFELRFSRKR